MWGGGLGGAAGSGAAPHPEGVGGFGWEPGGWEAAERGLSRVGFVEWIGRGSFVVLLRCRVWRGLRARQAEPALRVSSKEGGGRAGRAGLGPGGCFTPCNPPGGDLLFGAADGLCAAGEFVSEVLQLKFLRMFKHGLTYDHARLSGSIKAGSVNDSFLIFYCENFSGNALFFSFETGDHCDRTPCAVQDEAL